MTRVTAVLYCLAAIALSCVVMIPAVSAYGNDIPEGTLVWNTPAGMNDSGTTSDYDPFIPVFIEQEGFPFEEIGFCTDPFSITGTMSPGDIPAFQAGQVATLSPQFQASISSSARSPLAPFSPAVQQGGQVRVQFGVGAESDLSFHESQSADGLINSFSYQGLFTIG